MIDDDGVAGVRPNKVPINGTAAFGVVTRGEGSEEAPLFGRCASNTMAGGGGAADVVEEEFGRSRPDAEGGRAFEGELKGINNTSLVAVFEFCMRRSIACRW